MTSVRSVLLIANSNAGSAQDAAIDRIVTLLAARRSVDLALTRSHEEVRAGIAAHPDHDLVIAGGDGSVHVAVNAALRVDPQRLATHPVGIIPLGTGNDLAGALEVPEDVEEAVAVAVDGPPRTLDLLRADHGHHVVNAAHIGVGALAAVHGEALKPRLGSLAYRAGALAAGATNPAWNVRVTVDDVAVHDGPAVFVAAAVSKRVGGGVPVAPSAEPGEGLLHVVVIEALDNVATALRVGREVLAGSHLDDPAVRHVTGRRVHVEGDEAIHDADGELIGPLSSGAYEVVPRAWSVRVPRR